MVFDLTESIRWILLCVGFFMAGFTLISISRHPHWAVRAGDFPRAQMAVVTVVCAMLYAWIFFTGAWLDWFFLACMGLTVAWQVYRIIPYTVFAPVQVKTSDKESPSGKLRIIASNVLQTNRDFDRWMKMIRRESPDLILALETDEKWADAIEALADKYPWRVSQIQSNKYGMMLFSRLRLEKTAVRFLVEEDIPSIHADVILGNGERIRFHGIHPRPPEPIQDVDASARDAELVVMAREIREEKVPVVVAGDLNDVAWSKTTNLFRKISGLLDPRRGRGFFSTFPAKWPYLRWPLDHFFHSDVFQLKELRTLEPVGSDHLPVLIHLTYEPRNRGQHSQLDAGPEEKEIAQEKVAREFET